MKPEKKVTSHHIISNTYNAQGPGGPSSSNGPDFLPYFYIDRSGIHDYKEYETLSMENFGYKVSVKYRNGYEKSMMMVSYRPKQMDLGLKNRR